MRHDDQSQPDGNAARAVVQKLESLQRAGVTHLDKVPWERPDQQAMVSMGTSRQGATAGLPSSAGNKSQESTAGQASSGTQPSKTPLGKKKSSADGPTSGSAGERADALALVARDVAACSRCAELAQTRTQTVFGVGNPLARLAFLGEAPGADEDREGEPFVGRAGQLLNKIIAACTLRREDVYILNILRCRPPENRNPLPDEAANCREFLDRQLDIIRPEFICCLGAVAAQNLLQTTTPLGRLREKFHDYRGSKVLCTYHPAYLLRNPAAKRPTWEDMQRLMAAMGIDLPK